MQFFDFDSNPPTETFMFLKTERDFHIFFYRTTYFPTKPRIRDGKFNGFYIISTAWFKVHAFSSRVRFVTK